MRISKSFLLLLVVGYSLIQGEIGFAEVSRPDNEITKLADDVFLFRHQFHQSIFITTPKGVSRPTPPRVVPICRCVRRGGNAVLNWTGACHPIPLRLPDESNTWLRQKL